MSAIDFVQALEWVRSLNGLKVKIDNFLYLITMTEDKGEIQKLLLVMQVMLFTAFRFSKLHSRVENKVDGLKYIGGGVSILSRTEWP